MPEKFPAQTIEKPKSEALPKKEKKMVRVKQNKEYIKGLRRVKEELPQDVQIILKKVLQGREISEDELRRLNKVYQKLKNEQESGIKPGKTEETPKKKIKNHNYKVPSPKELFEKSGYKVPSPEELDKKLEKLQRLQQEKLKEQESLENLPANFLSVFKSGDQEKIGLLKKRMLAENAESTEWVEAIFGIHELIEKQIEIYKKKEKRERIDPRDFQDLTEYQFLIAHFVFTNRKNDEELIKFWMICNNIADTGRKKEVLNQLRSGIIGQVATARLLEESGANPSLSHPAEDAFKGIDLWANQGEEAFQVKGYNKTKKVHIFESDEISFPAVKTVMQKGGEDVYFNGDEYNFLKFPSFRIKISQYRKLTGRNFKGFLVLMPRAGINRATGEPAPELVEQFKKEYKKLKEKLA